MRQILAIAALLAPLAAAAQDVPAPVQTPSYDPVPTERMPGALPTEQQPAPPMIEQNAELIARGGEIATTWCDQCHVVRQEGTDIAPSFSWIAENRDNDEIRAFLQDPHGRMPPFLFSRPEIDAMVAYLEAIRQRGAPIPPVRDGVTPGSGSG